MGSQPTQLTQLGPYPTGRNPANAPRLSTSSARSADSQNLSQPEVDQKPWKYIGYKGYCEFISSENDFFVVRRFSAVSVRIALRLQDQVAILEDRLKELDKAWSRREQRDIHNGTFREDVADGRLEVMDELKEKLVEYNEFILQQSELKKHPRPSAQDLHSISNWHFNHQHKALLPTETNYLSHPSDLLSVVPKQKSPLRRVLERHEFFLSHSFWHQRKEPVLPKYDKDLDVITYISDKRIDSFITVVIVSVGMAMLIAPMWVLEFLDSQIHKLGAITAFIVGFLAMISFASSARPAEALVATAAYSAVLMVFLQLGTSSSPTG